LPWIFIPRHVSHIFSLQTVTTFAPIILFSFSIPLSFNICPMLPISRNLYLFPISPKPCQLSLLSVRSFVIADIFYINIYFNLADGLVYPLHIFSLQTITIFEPIIWSHWNSNLICILWYQTTVQNLKSVLNRRVLMFAYFFFSFGTVFLFFFHCLSQTFTCLFDNKDIWFVNSYHLIFMMSEKIAKNS
jgi:hypothetical protein